MMIMKDSGIEWIREIPNDWAVKKNKQCFELSKEIVGEASAATDLLSLTTKGVRLKSSSDASGKVPESYDTYQYVHENDLIMCLFDLDCSAVFSGLSHLYGMVSPAYKILSCKPTVDAKYADYWFRFVFDGRKFMSYSKTLRYTLTYEEFGVLPILCPDMKTQRQIASYLDNQCDYIDSVISATTSSIEEYKNLRQSVITHAVTRGVQGERPTKDSGVEWIGKIPEEWDVFRVAALYEERKENGNDELPILTVSINTGVSDRELTDEESERVFVRSEDKSKYMRVYPGDLTYNMMRAWQGAFGAVRVDGMVSPAYVIVKPRREIDSRYMEALLRTQPAKEEMKRYSHGIADFRLRLYWDKFRTIKVCFPPIEEQREIADYIDQKCAEIDALIAKKEQFLTELENYKKSMIYEYVTGKKEVPHS